MGRVSFVEMVIRIKGQEREAGRWEGEGEGGRKSIPGSGGVQASGQEHPLLVPGGWHLWGLLERREKGLSSPVLF